MHDDNAAQLLQAQIDDLRAREKVLKRAVAEQREQIATLRARLSPREHLRDALAACPACDHESVDVDALTDEEVAALLASHTQRAITSATDRATDATSRRAVRRRSTRRPRRTARRG